MLEKVAGKNCGKKDHVFENLGRECNRWIERYILITATLWQGHQLNRVYSPVLLRRLTLVVKEARKLLPVMVQGAFPTGLGLKAVLTSLLLGKKVSSLAEQPFFQPSKAVVKIHICPNPHWIFQPHFIRKLGHLGKLGREAQLDRSPPCDVDGEEDVKVG